MKQRVGSEHRKRIRTLHLVFAENRGFEKTYCPSEVAKAFRPGSWREHMDLVRKVADELIDENKLVVMQNNKIIMESASMTKGPIRLRQK